MNVPVAIPVHLTWHDLPERNALDVDTYEFKRVVVVEDGNYLYKWKFVGEVMV